VILPIRTHVQQASFISGNSSGYPQGGEIAAKNAIAKNNFTDLTKRPLGIFLK